MLAIAGRNFFQSRGFPATLPTPRHASCSNSGTSCARTDEAFEPKVCRASLAISLPFKALSSSALSRRLPSQSEIRSGAFWQCNLIGSIPDWKLVRPDAYSKGFFHTRIAFCHGAVAHSARLMPARSRRMGVSIVNPAARTIALTLSACPCPSSTTSRPRGASKRNASAAIAR